MWISLPLDRMTTAEKLQTMEELWDDLCRNQDGPPSPAWHQAVLAAREERVRAGTAEFTEWSKAKQEIRDSVK